MTWAEIAAEHIGHRCVLDDPRTIRCVDCSRKLLIPLRAEDAPTPTPPPFRPLGRPDLKPMPAWLKPTVAAELAARKHSRLSPTEQESSE